MMGEPRASASLGKTLVTPFLTCEDCHYPSVFLMKWRVVLASREDTMNELSEFPLPPTKGPSQISVQTANTSPWPARLAQPLATGTHSL